MSESVKNGRQKKTRTDISLTTEKLKDLLQPLITNIITEMNMSYRKTHNIYSRLCAQMNMRNSLNNRLNLYQIWKRYTNILTEEKKIFVCC